MKEPLALGHESSGIVTALGSDVTNFKIGDKVALEVGLPCETCDLCKAGRYNICKGMRFRSSAKAFPHFQGTLQEKINHPAKWCHKLPESLSLDHGAVLEPLGVAIHATRRARLPSGANVLVFGAGAVGLLCAYSAKQAGAARVLIADIVKSRIEFAVTNGFADEGFLVPMKRGQTVEEELEIAKSTAAAVIDYPVAGHPMGELDVIFECTGVPSCVQASIYATKAGGRVMLIGMGTPVYTLPVSAAALREVDICGVFRYANTYEEGISMMSKGVKPDLTTIVTHRFHGLENARAAFDMAAKTVDSDGKLVLKVVLDMSTQTLTNGS